MKDERAKKLGQDMKPQVRVGKKGLDDNMLAEIARRLEYEKLLKIKILRNAPETDMEAVADVLQKNVNGRVVEVKGRTLIIVDKRP